ncbi:23S rRNA (guanosine(2251)-2'-O)-methyltransferase RlmB [Microbulbifer thermotolerans]|uniref:23S rRNA (guanosine-2'-O-)-methyltransferase RlmB n=1 Tax=Microbulbifer thermotolerans TaxID=252514 RepID=A0A143HIV2_MICTH|nr:23S rRNA (guanosine(2251)-2'-O)-methyltransferase RlmB [Microbulbifer thermotolerans]AMX01410.1 23S rRNA (guanosine(2251)-2'-O)-methyltransferase RlmB [Microbulbifer thermotolerans]MCX2778244.1 23S rRNA (guanosine(2251)-2'-O)-methyltransferase RlmB [Microbulbifer thermotolerans]MCX2782033.1 23S rRNA (guanosine(2251)-2'-O)-methyltransferase RlmB [Microbulbifer thermotolerans]MCX2783209.1 23S rRNA (guanosine(2251)-2'-O)-methyltransferase RlmB [Microbulbifer thermotolerans]MCX2795578.1 23S rRN
MSTEIVYGLHAVQALLKSAPQQVHELLLLRGRKDQRLKKILGQAEKNHIAVRFADRRTLDEKVGGDGNHQGVVAVCEAQTKVFDERFLEELLQQLEVKGEAPFLLVLDGVTDPHNIGACLRSAEAAGVHAVIAPKDKSAGLTPTARKVACGAAEVLPFVSVTNLARTLQMLQRAGVWIFGAAGEAEQDIYQSQLTGPLALVMGAEGTGLRRLTREHCDHLIKIPMAGEVSSLNVSVATGVCLFEAVRQRAG